MNTFGKCTSRPLFRFINTPLSLSDHHPIIIIIISGVFKGSIVPDPPLEVKKLYLNLTWKFFMLNFEHFWKYTPEMYPRHSPLQISEHATDHHHHRRPHHGALTRPKCNGYIKDYNRTVSVLTRMHSNTQHDGRPLAVADPGRGGGGNPAMPLHLVSFDRGPSKSSPSSLYCKKSILISGIFVKLLALNWITKYMAIYD